MAKINFNFKKITKNNTVKVKDSFQSFCEKKLENLLSNIDFDKTINALNDYQKTSGKDVSSLTSFIQGLQSSVSKNSSSPKIYKSNRFQAILVAWLRDLKFEEGKAEMWSASREKLDLLAIYLKTFDTSTVMIENHTKQGKNFAEFYNKLTADRAEVIRQYLIEKGVPADRILAAGKGADADAPRTDILFKYPEITEDYIGEKAKAFQPLLGDYLKNISFEAGTDILQPFSITKLNLLASYLNIYNVKLNIVNHTYKGKNDDAFYLTLTMKRAIAIRDYLISRNIAADRLEYEGKGADATVQCTDFIFVK